MRVHPMRTTSGTLNGGNGTVIRDIGGEYLGAEGPRVATAPAQLLHARPGELTSVVRLLVVVAVDMALVDDRGRHIISLSSGIQDLSPS